MKTTLIIACAVVLFLAVNFFAFNERVRNVQSVPVSLPVPGPEANAESDISILILSETSCVFAGVTVEMANLQEHLMRSKAAGKNSVTVKMAPGVSHEPLIAALDLIRRTGIERVNIDVGQP